MKALFVVLLALGFSIQTFSQPQTGSGVTPEMRTQANTYFQAGEWDKASAAYEKIVEKEGANFGAHYRLGMSHLGLNKNEQAAEHIEKAFTGAPNAVFALALARAYARLDNKAKAFDAIYRSTTMGGIAPESLTGEKDFAAWLNDAGFKELVHKSDLATNPCKARPEFRQFDFWIGEWDAKNVQGVTVASSSIQLILGQCIIFENWNTPTNSGKSFNVFNATDGKWHQSWVDDKGTFTHYIGGLVDGRMVLTAETVRAGTKMLAKMTFSKLPNGDVRQFGENSTDDGKTWTTAFDFNYSRKK